MAKVVRPRLFSTHFGIPAKALEDAGLVDPFLNVDTQLFIDPLLLDKSANATIRGDGYAAFKQHFDSVVRLLALSKREGDPPWRGAQRLLDLHEPPENGLGYGGSGRSGSSRPDDVRESILRTAKQIVDLGSRDPEMISLMGFFEEKVGPDTISDFTTRVIVRQLAEITEDFCKANGVEVKKPDAEATFSLPHFLDDEGREKTTVLVPRDIVRDLPVANDWSEIEAATTANRRIRERVNLFLAGIAKPTVIERKAALRSAAMESAELFGAFLESLKEYVEHYDFNKDALGYYRMKAVLRTDSETFKAGKRYDLASGIDAISSMVHDTIDMFKHHVEKGNLWEELWIGDVPKRERAAQLIYFAMADCYCIANDIDISPEANMGGGPIDFKFSKGYRARVLVEMKRSGGSVRHGYERQLEFYKKAARTFHGIFVVMDFGDLGGKLEQILQIQRARRAAGEQASDIVVIDATRKASSSKRK